MWADFAQNQIHMMSINTYYLACTESFALQCCSFVVVNLFIVLMITGSDPQLFCTQLGYKSSQCLHWLRISSRRTFRLEQNFWGTIILLGSGIINGLNKSGMCSCMAIIWFVVAMWSGFAYLCVYVSLCVCICSVQSENLRYLEIMLRILRILRLHSNLEIA